MPRKPTFMHSVRKSLQDSQDSINVLRRANQTLDELDTPPFDATWQERVAHGCRKFLRILGRELLYAAWIPLQVLLIMVLNLVGAALLIWLLFWFLGAT
jgi:hypothetical protein